MRCPDRQTLANDVKDVCHSSFVEQRAAIDYYSRGRALSIFKRDELKHNPSQQMMISASKMLTGAFVGLKHIDKLTEQTPKPACRLLVCRGTSSYRLQSRLAVPAA